MVQKKFRIVLAGRVQGVNFRNFAKQTANKLSIYGFVRNAKDGNVEIIARGEEAKLAQFINNMERGPMLSSVSEVKKEELPIDEEEDDYFDIRF